MANKIHSISTIGVRWRTLRSNLLDNWGISNYLIHYLGEIKSLIKSNSIPAFKLLDIDNKPGKYYKTYDPDNLIGVATRIESKTLFKTILIDQVALTEDFLQDLMRKVYIDYPEKLASISNENQEEPKKYQKLIYSIIHSSDKQSIINKLIDEKVRSIFYGKPLDFFIADKAKIGFQDYFKNNFKKTVERYGEIIARRNVFTHNGGRVDEKYLSEVKDTDLKIGELARLDMQYLTDATRVCVGISTLCFKLVVENIYKEEFKGHNPIKIIRELEGFYEV